MPDQSNRAEVSEAERYWGVSYSYGWYGEFAGAFRDADVFHKFDSDDLDALAQIAAKCVKAVQMKECESKMSLRPGVLMGCTEHRGHPGRHNDQEWGRDV